jgi:hypothetical protein
MGIDKSLSDDYPSVIINGVEYHYGREPQYGQYLVENANYAKDYWCFDRKDDLVAFLVNLPESADRNRRRELYPDWSEVTSEQRHAYIEEDLARQRAKAEEKMEAGTAQEWNMDLEGENGPYEPQRITGRSLETPGARVERQLRGLEEELHRCNDAGRLHGLESNIDWTGVDTRDKEAILSRYVDFTKVTPEQFDFTCRSLAQDKFDPPDLSVARRLFEESRSQVPKTPLERVEREISKLKEQLESSPSDAGRLFLLEGTIDWKEVSERDKGEVLCRFVDFSQMAPGHLNLVYETLEDHMFIPPDSTVARKLFEQSRPRLSLFEAIGRMVSEFKPALESAMAAGREKQTEEVRLRDELRAGNHVLKRYYDLNEPPWTTDGERWKLSRLNADGSREIVMEGDGHDLKAIREEVKEELCSRRIGQELSEVRDLTRDVYQALVLDVWPSPAGIVDFGLNTQDHYAALQWAVREGDVTPKQLDAALGKGVQLQALITETNPYRGVRFRSTWDDLQIEPERDQVPEAEPIEQGRSQSEKTDCPPLTPLARVERQLTELKAELEGPSDDVGRLYLLEKHIDWSEVSEKDKEAVLTRHVDFSKITPEDHRLVYKVLDEELWELNDNWQELTGEKRATFEKEFNANFLAFQASLGLIRLRDELRAGSHVLYRYYDLEEPSWITEGERWQLSRVAADGSQEIVMKGNGHELKAIREHIKQELLAEKTGPGPRPEHSKPRGLDRQRDFEQEP